jgi:nucleotide-binding universal stress UspA family protein
MNNLLIATDMSSNAKNALKTGFDWAKKFKMDVTVIHVSESIAMENEECFSGSYGTLKDESVQKLDPKKYKKLAEHLSEFSNEEFKIEHWSGHAVECILKSQKKNDSNLVMTGILGHNTLRRMFLGSVAQRLVEESPVSVICVANSLRKFPTNALYCCDFMAANIKALEFGKAYSNVNGTAVTLFHILNPQTVINMNEKNTEIRSLGQALEMAEKEAKIELDFRFL